MAFEVRGIRNEAEFDQSQLLSAQSFGGDGVQPKLEHARKSTKPEWRLATFEDGEMTSMMQVIPSAMYLNGGTIPMGLVSPVASSPLHRRKGHAGQMLRHSLEVQRERGQYLSALYTPHPALYRRYGWEIAADQRRYEFKPKDCELQARPSQRGKLSFVTVEDWARLDAIYKRYAAQRNGPLDRDEGWWRYGVVNTWMGPVNMVVWTNDAGEDEGYCVYMDPVPPSTDTETVTSRELIALSGDAYLNLIAFLFNHDIRQKIVIWTNSEDALPLLFSDAERLDVQSHYTALIRVVDLEGALRSRKLADASLETEFTLEVTDNSAPWNQGTWRIRAAEGVITARKVDEGGELAVEARFLAPLFNGYVTPTSASKVGIVSAREESALARADALFGVTHRPYFTDSF